MLPPWPKTSYWPIAPLEDNAFVTCRTRAGVPASLHSSLTQWKNIFSFEVYGKEGYLAVRRSGRWIRNRKTHYREDRVRPALCLRGPRNSVVAMYLGKNEWLAFVNAIKTGVAVLGSGTDGVGSFAHRVCGI